MMRAKRVLLVFAAREKRDAPTGGIHKAVIAQIASLQANDVEVILVTASESAAIKAQSMGAEVHVSDVWHNSVKPLIFPKYWLTLLKIRSSGIDAVIHHSGRTWAWAGVFFCFIPNVQIFHREKVRPYRFFRRWIALSPAYAEHLKRDESLGGLRKISWAPNSFLEEPAPLKQRKAATENRPFVIGYIGRCDEGKGTTLLIEAVAMVLGKGHDIVLRFAGENHPPSQKLAETLGISERVEFTGWHDDIDPFIDAMDLLVLPSLKESFGLVIIESMVREKPVVATRCNGPAGIIEEGINGYLVDLNDASAIAEGIVKVINNPNRSEMGKAARELVISRYSPKPAGQRLIEALTELGADFS